MEKKKDNHTNEQSRRQFIQTAAIVGTGAMLLGPAQLFGNNAKTSIMDKKNKNIKVKGYAAFDATGDLKPWEFERRPVGENDILIDVKYSSICHSDIHQMRGHWGPQQYPQTPGHEIVGLVTAVGEKVTKFKVGDRAGVGCMVDGCTTCENEEQYQPGTLFTYGYPDKREPSGITQGGYSTQIVVRDHYALHIPESISFEHAAPLLCAGITTYSPLKNFDALKKGHKVGVVGIGGLGHMAIKLAVSKGAEVYAFTTTANKVEDIKKFGAKEAIVVNSPEDLLPWRGKLDYMISTVPYAYQLSSYIDCVKPYGYYTQVGQPVAGALEINNFNMIFNRVNFNGSLIGGIKDTQEVVDYCADNGIVPEIEIIKADQVNEAWEKVINKEARYRYVIDASTF